MHILPLFQDDPFVIEILDIGAALSGTPPYQGLVDAGFAHITGFEPDQASCDTLNQTYGSTHRFLPRFVGAGGAAIFHETNWSLTGSLLEPNTELLSVFQNLSESVTPVAKHRVETVSLDALHKAGDLPDIDYIKIDIQGGELDVFRHARRLMNHVLAIQTEVEFVTLYKNQPLFADVDVFLRNSGFQFHTFTGFGSRAFKPVVLDGDINKGVRQYLWSDAVYFRDWLNLEPLSDLQLKKLATLAHEIYQSVDLAYYYLLALDQRLGRGSDLAVRFLQQSF